ncbi:GAF and ANTAR domain-containing protein [Arthrobacter sp. D1-17]
MDSPGHAKDVERLQDLVAGMDDIKEFLDGMTALGAAAVSRASSARIECAVTLRRRKRCATIAGSSDDAILLDGMEQRLGEGPCAEAVKTGEPVLLADVSGDVRWPQYRQELADLGCRSVLGVPLDLGEDAAAVLSFFASATGVFTQETIAEAAAFASGAGRALRLGIRITAADLRAGDLAAAMARRTPIDLACGIIMAQSRCPQSEAFEILRKLSSNRHQKLHDVAQAIVSRSSGAIATTHFEA